VAEAQERASSAPDSVRDKKVKVTGVISRIGTQTAAGAVTHLITLTPSKGETSPRLLCDFHKTEPVGAEVGATVTVEGRGELQKVANKDGTTGTRLDLRDCAFVK
jgi:hypothetical protein